MSREQPVGRQVHEETEAQIGRTVHESPSAPKILPAKHEGGRLSRESMEQVIKNGGSVLHNGTVINSVAGLPSESALASAAGDTEALAKIREGKLAEIQRLQAELSDEDKKRK